MATLLETYNLRDNPNLKTRAASAFAAAAQDIMNELSTVTGHTERFAWASTILLSPGGNGPDNEVDRAIHLILRNATVADGYVADTSGSTVNDGDIQFTINGLINVLAGVDTSTP